MNYVNVKLLTLLQLLYQGKGRKYIQKVPLCWGAWFCLSSCSYEKSHTAGQWSSGSTETICNNLNIVKKNYFVNEQFCSREAVWFFWDPVVSCWHLKHFIFVTTPFQGISVTTPFQGKHFSYCFPLTLSPIYPFLTCWLQLAPYVLRISVVEALLEMKRQFLLQLVFGSAHLIWAAMLSSCIPVCVERGLHGGVCGGLGSLTLVFLLAL